VFNRGEKVKDSRSYLDLFQRRVNAKESNYNAHLKAILVLHFNDVVAERRGH
jgi:hypothetical protein